MRGGVVYSVPSPVTDNPAAASFLEDIGRPWPLGTYGSRFVIGASNRTLAAAIRVSACVAVVTQCWELICVSQVVAVVVFAVTELCETRSNLAI